MKARFAVIAASVVLGLVALCAVAPGLLATHDPLQVDLRAALAAPNAEHLFGTDQSGRDVFSRVVHGAARSIGVGVVATGIALVAGLVAGSLAGLAPRPADTVLMRINDVLMAFPEFLVALVLVAILGPGPFNVAFAVTAAAVPVYVRMARTHTRTLRVAEHVEAARILGVPGLPRYIRHVMPGVLSSLSVLATIGVGTAILAAAGLSFIGLGPAEPTPEWGLMLSGGRNVLGAAWWVSLFPGLAITLTVLATSVIGRALRARAEERVS